MHVRSCHMRQSAAPGPLMTSEFKHWNNSDLFYTHRDTQTPLSNFTSLLFHSCVHFVEFSLCTVSRFLLCWFTETSDLNKLMQIVSRSWLMIRTASKSGMEGQQLHSMSLLPSACVYLKCKI